MLLSLCIFWLMSSFKGVQRQRSALSGRGDAEHIEGDWHQSGTARGDWRKMIEKWKWFWGRLPQKASLMTMFATVDSRSYSWFLKSSQGPSEILVSTFEIDFLKVSNMPFIVAWSFQRIFTTGIHSRVFGSVKPSAPGWRYLDDSRGLKLLKHLSIVLTFKIFAWYTQYFHIFSSHLFPIFLPIP